MSAKTFKGKVISTKMNKTVVVSIDVSKRHKLYDKVVTKTRNFKARDELGVGMGDIVTIQECRPYSKEVTWKVIEKVEDNRSK